MAARKAKLMSIWNYYLAKLKSKFLVSQDKRKGRSTYKMVSSAILEIIKSSSWERVRIIT